MLAFSATRSGSNVAHSAFAETLFQKPTGWSALANIPFAHDQLTIVLTPNLPPQLSWQVPHALRPNDKLPTTISLEIPALELSSQSGWEFKGGLLANFLHSSAHSSAEPLKSPFFQALMRRGFKISGIQNASISDSSLTLCLAPRASLSDLSISVDTTLEAKELLLTNLNATSCRLTFGVAGGRWSNCSIKGGQSQILGDLGTTFIDDDCVLHNCYVTADCSKATFAPKNLSSRLSSSTFPIECAPENLKAILQPMAPDALKALLDRVAQQRWTPSSEGTWSARQDRGSSQTLLSPEHKNTSGEVP